MSYTLRVDNQLFEWLERQTPEGATYGETLRSIIEKLGAQLPPVPQRSLAAERRREIYRSRILAVLLEQNGEARVADIKTALYEKVAPNLSEGEKNWTKSARPAWWYDAEYERFEMIRDGLIDGSSPRGYWKLTQKGRKRAKSSTNERER